MSVLEGYEPQKVLYYFEEISKIPHGSGNRQPISDYLVEFAKNHGLKYVQDESLNVVIYKDGTKGYENAPTVILQGHMDMVCEKRQDVEHDFTKNPLNLGVENGYITANGTTLGGDDGIAVAYALALLDSTDLSHPPIEAVITVDEEIGLLGANDLDCSILKGRRFINLDSEAEGNLWISCAGGVSGISEIPMNRIEAEGTAVEIKITGLVGGHSGAEIDKIRANANILMGRYLHGLKAETEFYIVSLSGGQKENAITREAAAELLVGEDSVEEIIKYSEKLQAQLRNEYAGTDPDITILVEKKDNTTTNVLHPISAEKVIFYLMNIPYAIQKMSGTIENLVETSTNPGIVALKESTFYVASGIRSSIESARDALSDKVQYLTEFLGGTYTIEGAYPAWEYREESPLRDKMVEVYEKMYGTSINVVAIHAGLECGLFFKKMEGLDCVSIGPNMKDIHTSEEVLEIASVERVWNYLVKVLEELKD
ncbi:MAG: aminoacyl-histidine dipeptidase [Eubacteriales bacterium]|nr:aminoacyl-histidine dipeptidase [Eubacteriales bacterium]